MKIFGYRPGQIRKAIAGGIAPVVPLLAVDLVDLHISRLEAGGLVGAAVLGFAAVFGVKSNDPVPVKRTRDRKNVDPAPGQD